MDGRRKGHLITKVITFQNDKKEKPFYRIMASQNEKHKGIQILQYLFNFFSFGKKDLENYFNDEKLEQEKLRRIENKKVKWTRDEKGNIVSPFRKKMKDRFDYSNS